MQHQRETGQIVSDLDEVLNEDVLALHTWKGVIAQLPGTLTGLGILGTFVGLLLGLRGISFVTVEAALGSVQSILAGINTAFYTSIAGVILSILFNITNNVLRTIMNRETGLFLEEFHKSVIPTTDEQARYSSRREVRQSPGAAGAPAQKCGQRRSEPRDGAKCRPQRARSDAADPGRPAQERVHLLPAAPI
ncbi:MotA/TolQ/ExbB proton channel family protein [Faecalibacterium sp. 7]|uniref:MotA/TolQ/ExbB proton channel family protein n=1 Tax=Faecalibacterium sp. 7 TaxID=3402017 RepID=UPI003C2E1D7D